MKTILNFSIALMLLAGSVGAFEFFKMYRTGEINRIYEPEAKPVSKSVETVASPAPKTDEHTILNPGIGKKIKPTVEKPVVKTPENINAEYARGNISALSLATPTVARPVKADDNVEDTSKKTVSKRQFSMRMYSRAPLRAIDYEVVLDSVKPVTVLDTTAVKQNHTE